MDTNILGKIKSVAVRNFLTYDELKFIPGRHLNIIIGPNGTGKSSIIAAIILGCGGKPSIMSRSKDVADYVKNGKTKACIEIELIRNEDGEVTVFNRNFDKNSKESYRVDGATISAKAYCELIKTKFNIHVDNLCMFLPQDRVQDFTKLNPQEILQSTITSVCSQDMIDTFEELKETREIQKNLSKSYHDINIQLKDHQNRNEQLHTIIENSKMKEKLVQKVELFQKKLAWMKFDRAKAEYDEAAGDVLKLKEAIENKKQLLKPLEKRQLEIAGTKKALQDSIKKADESMVQHNDEIEKLFEKTNQHESDIGLERQNLRNILATAKDYEKELKELELVVALEKKEYDEAQKNLESEGNIGAIMKEFDKELLANKNKIDKIQQKRDEIMRHLDETIYPQIQISKMKIEKMNDTNSQKFRSLRENFEDAYRAYQWLEENRHKFRGHIFNPIITEITVTEKKYAKYVENIIAGRDFETFLCTNKEDMRDLIVQFRNQMHLQVNVGYTDPTETLNFRSDMQIDRRLQNLGIYAYVLDVIDAPVPILNYLCGLYRIHNTAIGNDRTYECASQLPDHINVFFSTNHRFAVNVSSYSGKKSTSSVEIAGRNIVNVGLDQTALDQEHRQLAKFQKQAENLKAELIPFQNHIAEIERQSIEIKNKKGVIEGKLKNIKKIEAKLKKKEAELMKMKNTKIDINEERQKSKNTVDGIVMTIIKNNSKIAENLEKYNENYVKHYVSQKKLQMFDDSTGNIDEQIQKLKHDMRLNIDTLERASRLYERLEKDMDLAKQEALKLTDDKAPTDRKFKYKEAFKTVPDEYHAVEDQICEMQGRIECIRGVDPKILAEYEERKQTIEELQHQLKNEQERTVQLEAKLQSLHSKWYPEITSIVHQINGNFSSFFAKMGFVGEVELTCTEERDYNTYGIQILVQYRNNEKLQALNRHVQSGGERAVAIAVFTLSLQHLSVVPFRCVDEINQGMDPKNERKIFQMLVDITCRPGEAQYFFVTPKLLPNLPYHDLMTVSVVHNGKYIEDSYVFMPNESDEDE